MRRDRWQPSVYLARSSLHGIGVFARVAFVRDQVIGRAETLDLGLLTTFDGLPTVGIVGRNMHMHVVIGGFPLWYMNYSDEPNANAEATGRIRALRDIRAGEELTLRAFAAMRS